MTNNLFQKPNRAVRSRDGMAGGAFEAGLPSAGRRLTLVRLALAAVTLGFLTTGPQPTRADVAVPTVTGPISGGTFDRPFNPLTNPEGIDFSKYDVEEYFLEGHATTFAPAPGTTLESDGEWEVISTGSQPYKTRILVIRPKNERDFDGTVIASWLNVTSGFEIANGTEALLLPIGAAWVGVSAQRVGVHGFLPFPAPGVPPGLKVWDPIRYASLEISDDQLSYDIFSQAGQLVGPDRPNAGTDLDPMAGLRVERVVATGASQSAGRLLTYINAAHPLAQVYDGFLIDLWFGRGSSLAPGVEMPAALNVRRDLDVPSFVRNTETEALSLHPARQSDTNSYVMWEAAGLAHAGLRGFQGVDNLARREFGFSIPPSDCDLPLNSLFFDSMLKAAMLHMNDWVQGGPPPPSQPPIAISGDPATIERDRYGNALGGLRVPGFAVPTARHLGTNTPSSDQGCRLGGASEPFTQDVIDSLYRNHGAYVSRFVRAANDAQAAGFLLPRDAQELKKEAARAPVP